MIASASPRRSSRGLAVCVAVLACLAGAAAPSSASAAQPRSFWGVVPINNLSSSELDLMGAGRVGTLRQLVIWPSIEHKRGSYDWSYLDFLVANAARNGIEVLPFVYGTPGWVKVDCHGLSAELCQRVPPLSKDGKKAWSGFLTALAGRYGSQGSFWTDTSDAYDPPYLPITKWQIWNEPSSQTYYRPHPDPRGYAALVKTSDRALAAADPEAEVVLAGIFPAPEGGEQFHIAPFLRSFYKSKGIVKHFDIAALHPYARTLNGLKSQINNVRRQMRRGGARNKRLWITELGWGSDPPVANRPLIKGIDGQREMLERSFKLLADRAGHWKLQGVLWYAWRDPGIGYENCPFCSSAGLLKENGDPKPAWHSFVDFTGGSANPPE
jgi:polysaccharide biosynthesis protein PslG